MKPIHIVFIVLAVVFGAVYFFPRNAGAPVAGDKMAHYANPELGLRLSYRENPDGYMLHAIPPSPGSDPTLITTIVLMANKDMSHALHAENTEGPPTITIQVAKNTKKLAPLPWANEYNILSNIALKLDEPTAQTIAGGDAVRYKADGLYASDNAVITHGDFVYVFTGNYADAEAPIRKDFESILASLEFIPSH